MQSELLSRTPSGVPMFASGMEPLAAPQPRVTKRKVQRHSPDRLLRQKLVLPGDITISAEKHKGRLVVRVESPDGEG